MVIKMYIIAYLKIICIYRFYLLVIKKIRFKIYYLSLKVNLRINPIRLRKFIIHAY